MVCSFLLAVDCVQHVFMVQFTAGYILDDHALSYIL